MATQTNKWIDATAKLIELTQEGTLKWAAEEPPEWFSKRPNQRVEVVFETDFKGKLLRLYEKGFQQEEVDINFYGQAEPTVEWRTKVVLEFIDNNGNTLWSFPYVSALNDLMSAVKFQAAGVKDFLREILGEE